MSDLKVDLSAGRKDPKPSPEDVRMHFREAIKQEIGTAPKLKDFARDIDGDNKFEARFAKLQERVKNGEKPENILSKDDAKRYTEWMSKYEQMVIRMVGYTKIYDDKGHYIAKDEKRSTRSQFNEEKLSEAKREMTDLSSLSLGEKLEKLTELGSGAMGKMLDRNVALQREHEEKKHSKHAKDPEKIHKEMADGAGPSMDYRFGNLEPDAISKGAHSTFAALRKVGKAIIG